MGKHDTETALGLMKARLNRLHSDAVQDEYLRARIEAAAQRLAENGIVLDASPGDTMLLVDMATWDYQNRDRGEAMPAWLREVRRDRWMKGGGTHDS